MDRPYVYNDVFQSPEMRLWLNGIRKRQHVDIFVWKSLVIVVERLTCISLMIIIFGFV